jgi:hypothetical protein
MKERNPILVFVFGFITLGIYTLYRAVVTKTEMNRLGEKIPTAWIILIPIVGYIWWYWKYSEGVEHVTKGKLNGILAFILLYLLGSIGEAIVQDSFNQVNAIPVTNAGTVSPNQTIASPEVTATNGATGALTAQDVFPNDNPVTQAEQPTATSTSEDTTPPNPPTEISGTGPTGSV